MERETGIDREIDMDDETKKHAETDEETDTAMDPKMLLHSVTALQSSVYLPTVLCRISRYASLPSFQA